MLCAVSLFLIFHMTFHNRKLKSIHPPIIDSSLHKSKINCKLKFTVKTLVLFLITMLPYQWKMEKSHTIILKMFQQALDVTVLLVYYVGCRWSHNPEREN